MNKYILILVVFTVQFCYGQEIPPTANYAKYLDRTKWPPDDMSKDGKTHIFAVKLTYENGHILQPLVFSKNSSELFKNFIQSQLPGLDTLPWHVFIPAVKGLGRYTIWWLQLYASGDHDCAGNPFTTTDVIRGMNFAFDAVNKEKDVVFIAPPYFVQYFSSKFK